MTQSEDPKQLFFKKTLKNIIEEASQGGIMEEASWRRHQGGGIKEEASWTRHLEEASWRRHHGGGI